MTNQELLEKFAQNTASEEETFLFWDRVKALSVQDVADLLEQYESLLGKVTDYGPLDKQMFQEMQQRVTAWETKKNVYSLRRYWAAASLVFLIAIGAYFWQHKGREQVIPAASRQSSMDLAPGKAGAVLTLADGKEVVLDSLGNGVVASQGGSTVLLKNGQLAYDPTGNEHREIVYNTMSTPKGRQFQVALPDGTIVWLNAASSISFPTVFKGPERRVKITGEAYFEVVKDRSKPFIVDVSNREVVEVLGTAFNINSYEDESFIKTTLLKGSVRVVSNEDKGIVLQPGQQAQLLVNGKPENEVTISSGVDLRQVVAWKDDVFNFSNMDIPGALRQIARWYDLDIHFDGKPPVKQLRGTISRNLSLSEVLQLLSELDLSFKLEGKTLTVKEIL